MKNTQPIFFPCNNGPYIWDKSDHLEGIGSTFQWRKPSFIAAHITSGSWIGNLTNAHEKDAGDQSEYFGLALSHCDKQSLEMYEKTENDRFIYVPKGAKMFEYIPTLQLSNKTVITFEWHHVDQTHNFILFNKIFRERFHQQRLTRNTPRRTMNEFWVTIHFRWGDVNTKEPNKPDIRSGLGFSDYCACIKRILDINPAIKVFLFAEGFKSPELCDAIGYKNVIFLSESGPWKMHIDIMSQSSLLIGGQSSFFVLGSHLCENCTVIHDDKFKFSQSDYERKLPTHLNAIYCEPRLQCYLEQIERHLSS